MSLDRTYIKDETPLVGISELRGIGGSYTITQIINQVPNFINQGIETLTANVATSVTFDVELSDVNYTIVPRFGFSATSVAPVSITNKATTGFDVTSRINCTYEWIAVKI